MDQASTTTIQPGDPGTYVGRDGNWYDADGNNLGPSGQAATPPAANVPPPGNVPVNGAPNVTQPPPVAPPPGPPVDHTGNLGPAPTFTPPTYTKPPAFSYADFVAPDPNKLSQDPSYQYTLRTEQDAIQKSAAARGVLNTGGTINNLLLNAQDVASQGYQGLFNRDLQSYMTNRGNAVDTYNQNYQTQYKDPYSISYQGANDAFNAGLHNYDLSKQYGWYGNLFDFSKDQDAFNRQYQLLQLT